MKIHNCPLFVVANFPMNKNTFSSSKSMNFCQLIHEFLPVLRDFLCLSCPEKFLNGEASAHVLAAAAAREDLQRSPSGFLARRTGRSAPRKSPVTSTVVRLPLRMISDLVSISKLSIR